MSSNTQIKNAVIDYRYDYSSNPLDVSGHIINSAEQLNPLLAHLKSIGYNTVALTLDVPIDMRTGLINVGNPTDQTNKDLPRDIWKSVDYAHSIGLSVNLVMIPCIIFQRDGTLDPSDTAISTNDLVGDPLKNNLSIDTVFKSITEYETKIASLAQQHGVEGYYIGSENYGYDTAEYLPYWQTIVNSVKQVFSGQTLYQAAYDNAVFGIVDTVAYVPNAIVSTTPMYDLSKIIEALYQTPPWAGSKQNYIEFLSGLADKYSNKTFILDDFTANAANAGIGTTFFPFSVLMSDSSKLSELPQPNYKQQALAYQMMIYVANYLLPNKIEGIGLAEYTMWGDASWIQQPQNDVGQLWNLMDRDSANLMNNPIVDSAIKNAFLYNPLLPLPLVPNQPTGSVTITGDATQNKTLIASNDLADANGLGTITYTWFGDGTTISNASQSTYTLNQADVGKKISVKASYTDGFGTQVSVESNSTSSIINVNDAPTGSVIITGDLKQNQILTASNTLVDIDGIGIITYTWLRDGTPISNATQTSYTLTQADVGKKISVKASYTDGFGASESVISNPTSSIINLNDRSTGGVKITGDAAQNQILTTSNSLADTDGLGLITYQWFRDGTVVSNATQATYKLSQGDVGKKISVQASYTDGFGTAESVSSDPTSSIINVNDAPTGSVTITGKANKGCVLAANNTLADLDGISAVSYQWMNNGIVIPNATHSQYTVTQADTGQKISVQASYTDLQNTPESVSSSSVLVAANLAPAGSVTIKGVSTFGSTLSITNTIKDADGLGKLSYSWQNDKGTLSNKPTYTLVDSDIGTKVWAVVSYTDKKGNIEQVDSKPVTVTISARPSAVHDLLTGTDGADKLNGLAGNDTLIGGVGADTLTGGIGADAFKYNSVADSTPKNHDVITDYKHAQSDKIDLSAIDANLVLTGNKAFTFIGSAAFNSDATGQLRFDPKTSTLYGSINADSTPELAVVLTGVKSLVVDDLIL